MKRIMLIMGVGSILAFEGFAENLHWVGAGGSGIGNFEDPANWTEEKVAGAADLAAINNNVSKNFAVTFNSDVTNATVSLMIPSPMYETLFIMNQHVWTATNSLYVWEASGGRLTFTNGTLRTNAANFSPSYGALATNLVLTMKDVVSDFGTMQFCATTTSFEGGSLRVSNGLTVGIAGLAAATLRLDKNVQCDVTNALYIGSEYGATGELVNVAGELRHNMMGSNFMVGRNGCGAMTINGGSTYVSGTLLIGNGNTSVGNLTVSGGLNTFGKGTTESTLFVANSGKGTLLSVGGTNSVSGTLVIGYNAGSVGEMTLTNGLWNIGRFLYVGQSGSGTLNINGGELRLVGENAVMPVARYAGATGTVSVSDGLLDVNGELWLGGGGAASVGLLKLSGNGVLRVKTILEKMQGHQPARHFSMVER